MKIWNKRIKLIKFSIFNQSILLGFSLLNIKRNESSWQVIKKVMGSVEGGLWENTEIARNTEMFRKKTAYVLANLHPSMTWPSFELITVEQRTHLIFPALSRQKISCESWFWMLHFEFPSSERLFFRWKPQVWLKWNH